MEFSHKPPTPVFGLECWNTKGNQLTQPGQFTLILIKTGSIILEMPDGKTRALAGDILIHGSKSQAYIHIPAVTTVSVLHIDAEYLVDTLFWTYPTILRDHTDAKRFCLMSFSSKIHHLRMPAEKLSDATKLIDSICALSAAEHSVHSSCHLQSQWYQLVCTLFPLFIKEPLGHWLRSCPDKKCELASRKTQVRQEAARAKQLLESAIDYEWTLENLSHHVHISARQLSRIFKEAFGLTPTEYLTSLRVGAMAKLLRETESNTEMVAQAVGWRSRARASDAFTKFFGIPPGEYRILAKRDVVMV